MEEQNEFINEYLEKIGKRIRTLRKENYTSYEKFAFTHDLNRVTYGRIENGKDLLMSNFLKVLKALDVTPQEFFAEGFEVVNNGK